MADNEIKPDNLILWSLSSKNSYNALPFLKQYPFSGIVFESRSLYIEDCPLTIFLRYKSTLELKSLQIV